MFKKFMMSNYMYVVGDTSNPKNFFPGFKYRIGSTIYTIKSDCSKDPHAPMREVFLSDGSTEIIPIETLQKDIEDPQAVILEPDMRLVPDAIKKEIEAAKLEQLKKNGKDEKTEENKTE